MSVCPDNSLPLFAALKLWRFFKNYYYILPEVLRAPQLLLLGRDYALLDQQRDVVIVFWALSPRI
jgi:hypothetical protein